MGVFFTYDPLTQYYNFDRSRTYSFTINSFLCISDDRTCGNSGNCLKKGKCLDQPIDSCSSPLLILHLLSKFYRLLHRRPLLNVFSKQIAKAYFNLKWIQIANFSAKSVDSDLCFQPTVFNRDQALKFQKVIRRDKKNLCFK